MRRNLQMLAVLLAVAGLGAANADTRLVDAVRKGDKSAVQALLKQKVDVNAPQGDGATALHWAAHRDDVTTLDALIKAGANVNAANDVGVTPLWLASLNGNPTVAERLLKAGAQANVVLPSGETALMTAARTGNVDVVKLLLAHRADVNAREKSQGQTALMWAVSQEHADVVRTLVEAGADIRARTDQRHRRVNTETGGFGREILDEVDLGGFTPLLFAARAGNLETAKVLVEAGADVNDKAPEGSTALMTAALSGHGPVGVYLLEKGADPNLSSAGYTALHAATVRGELDLVKALIAKGVNVNTILAKGTPMRRSSVDYGVPGDYVGANAVWLAARYQEPEIMKALAAAGAVGTAKANKDGSTLMQATLQGTRRGESTITVDPATTERLILEGVMVAVQLGADVNQADGDGSTPLHVAAQRRYNSVVQFLAEKGANLEATNKKGVTPLGLVSAPNAKGTAELLRKLGATK